MTTYYAAQLGIALSVVDSRASYMRDQQLLEKAAPIEPVADSARQRRQRLSVKAT